MALTPSDKLHVATWNNTNDKLLLRSFDGGTTFILTQALGAISETNDRFLVRQDTMLDRTDVTLVSGIVISEVKTAVLDLTYPSGYTGGPLGLGYKVAATNFATPTGYAITYTPEGDLVYQKSITTSPVTTVAASTAAEEAAAKKATFWGKYSKYVWGLVIVAAVGVVAFFSFKKK